MKNRLTGVIIGQIIGLVIVCMISTFIALVSFGGIAGVTIAANPEKIFQYTAPLACPNGTIKFEQYTASYNRPGEHDFNVSCIASDGTSTDVSLPAIGYALLGFYLVCFLPLCIPGGLVAIIIPLFFLRGGNKQESNSQNMFSTL